MVSAMRLVQPRRRLVVELLVEDVAEVNVAAVSLVVMEVCQNFPMF
jgi:hypothetical protein